MFKVVWKSFKYNRKNFLSFFMSEILSVAVIFMLIYIQEALSQVPGIKTEALQFAYQSELRKQLRIIIPCIILIMILVTGYSVKAYINTRIWDYKLFQLLGIRKKNLKVMIGLEYVISGMLACGFGILFGLIGTKIIKEILHTRINARFVKGISMSRVYLVLILSCLIMTIGVYITLQILLDTRTNLGDKIFKIKESRIHSMISVIYFIVGILVISSGYLLVNNDPMMAYMARREIGFIYQDYYLMDSLSVRENIMLPKILDHSPVEESITEAEKLADIMGVRALLDKKIFELSGGEKQRAAICRALMNHSDLILADEPTGNLDSASSETVMEYLQMINKDLKKAVVLVTHDAYVASFCDRVIFVKDGNIEVQLRKKEKQDVFCDKIMKAQKDILKNK